MKAFIWAALAAGLAACSGPLPENVGGRDPSDPRSVVPPVHYASVAAGTVDFKPVDPKPWLERNRSVTPKTGSAQ